MYDFYLFYFKHLLLCHCTHKQLQAQINILTGKKRRCEIQMKLMNKFNWFKNKWKEIHQSASFVKSNYNKKKIGILK